MDATSKNDIAAQLTADSGRCVVCGLCVPLCPTYTIAQNEAESPRGRIALMRALADGTIAAENKEINHHLDSCTGCRACEAACPAAVPYGRMLEAARALRPAKPRLAERLLLYLSGLSPRSARAWGAALRLVARGPIAFVARALPGAFGRLARLVPRHAAPYRASLAAPSASRGRVGLFTGCVNRLVDHETIEAAHLILTRLGYEPVIPDEALCCGALDTHAGKAESGASKRKQTETTFAAEGVKAIVYIATGCGATLMAQAGAAPVHEICDFVARDAELARLKPKPNAATVSIHSPCSHKYPVGNVDAVEKILGLIPKLETSKLKSTHCCGGAGSYPLTHPAEAASLAKLTLEALPAQSDYLVSTNIGCALNLGAHLKRPATRVMHPIALLGLCLKPED